MPAAPQGSEPVAPPDGAPVTREHRAPVSRIHHVGITVADLDRSLAFYRDLLGMRVLGHSEAEQVGAIVGMPGATARIADLDAGGGQLLELLDYGTGPAAVPPRGPDAAGSCHVCFQVADLDAALARLARAGHRTMGEPVRLGGGEGSENVPHGAPIGREVWQDCTVAYVRDPDGVIVELLEHAPGPSAPDGAPDG